jgi:hypothetical protein
MKAERSGDVLALRIIAHVATVMAHGRRQSSPTVPSNTTSLAACASSGVTRPIVLLVDEATAWPALPHPQALQLARPHPPRSTCRVRRSPQAQADPAPPRAQNESSKRLLALRGVPHAQPLVLALSRAQVHAHDDCPLSQREQLGRSHPVHLLCR